MKIKINELEKISDSFVKTSMDVNHYFLVYKQYSDNYHESEYLETIRLSPAFYGVVQSALFEALFVTLGRIYDSQDKRSISIKNLYDFVLQNKQEITSIAKWGIYDNIPEELKKAFSKEKYFDEQLEKYGERYSELEPTIKKMRNSRNKLFAHNNKDIIMNDNGEFKSSQLTVQEVVKLINFSLEFSRMLVGYLTDVSKPEKAINIDDWNNTLFYAKQGYESKKH